MISLLLVLRNGRHLLKLQFAQRSRNRVGACFPVLKLGAAGL